MSSTDGTVGGKQEVQSRIAYSVPLLTLPSGFPARRVKGAGYGFCGAVCGVAGRGDRRAYAGGACMVNHPINPSLHHKL